MKNNKSLGLAVLGILFVLFNIVVFLVGTLVLPTFWVGYIFTVLAFVVVLAFALLGGARRPDLTFMNLPLLRYGLIYLVVQMALGFVLCTSLFIGFRFAVIAECMLLALFLILGIGVLMSYNNAAAIRDTVAPKVQFIKMIGVDIQSIEARATDPDLKATLADVAETVRFSDPMSHPSLAGQENAIAQTAQQVAYLVDQGDIPGAKAAAGELKLLFEDRNRKVKALK